jgi:hypothetical protein
LLDVFCFEVVKADLVNEGIERWRFESEDRFEVEPLNSLVATAIQGIGRLTPGIFSCMPRMATAVTVSFVWLLSIRATSV